MMAYHLTNIQRTSYILSLGLLYILLLIALTLWVSGNDGWLGIVRSFGNEIIPSLKSILYAFYVAGASTLCATWMGFAIYQCDQKTRFSLHWIASLLILPFLLGNSSAAYLQKLIFYDSAIFEAAIRSGWLSMHALGGLGAIWQYGSLGAYLCYLALTQLATQEIQYTRINHLPDRYFYFDIYTSRITSLSAILFLFFYLFSYYEYTKLHLLYKPSVAAGTELATHSLARIYKTISISDPSIANISIFSHSLFLIAIVIGSAFLFLNLWMKIRETNRAIVIPHLKNRPFHKRISSAIYWFTCIVATVFFLSPVIFGIVANLFSFKWENIAPLMDAIFPIMPVALVLTLASSLLAMVARIGWSNWTSKVNIRFALFVALSCVVTAVPPITIAITALYYKGTLLQGSTQYYYLWSLAMLLAYLPLITVFFLASYLSIDKSELDYAKIHKLGLKNIIKDIFGWRFLGIYLLTFLLSTSLILNDYTINNVFSDFVASLSGIFDRSLVGRSENQGLAASLLILSSMLAFSILMVWNFVRRSAIKESLQ